MNEFWTDDLKSVILNNSFDSIICYNPVIEEGVLNDFKIIYLNNTALTILGGRKEDHIGRSFLQKFPYSTKNGLFEDMKNVFNTGQAYQNVYYFERGGKGGWSHNAIARYEYKIIIYFRNVTEIKQLELELAKKNTDLELMMKESHHRLKNNLQIIASILQMEKNNVNSPLCSSILDICSLRINTMAMIHRILYEDMSYPKVNMKTFVNDLAVSIINLYSNGGRISVSLDVDEFSIFTDEAIKLGLIINELLTNCYKYAFPDERQGLIKLSLKELNQNYSLLITDNGIGLPEELLIENIKSVGMLLVKTFSDELGGKLMITKTGGTSIQLIIPKKLQTNLKQH